LLYSSNRPARLGVRVPTYTRPPKEDTTQHQQPPPLGGVKIGVTQDVITRKASIGGLKQTGRRFSDRGSIILDKRKTPDSPQPQPAPGQPITTPPTNSASQGTGDMRNMAAGWGRGGRPTPDIASPTTNAEGQAQKKPGLARRPMLPSFHAPSANRANYSGNSSTSSGSDSGEEVSPRVATEATSPRSAETASSDGITRSATAPNVATKASFKRPIWLRQNTTSAGT